ncbi:MAG: hypothetical protein ABIV51_09485 [Saprospiraceae bacterium]
MKHFIILPILLLSMAIYGQAKAPTKLERAKASVKKHLMRNLNDPSSYQSVEWGSVVAIQGTFDEQASAIPELKFLIDKMEYYKLFYESSGRTKNDWEISDGAKAIAIKNEQLYLDSFNLAKIQYDKAIAPYNRKYKAELLQYSIKHEFRAKNAMGALMLNCNVFVLDNEFKVESAYDCEE